MTSILWLKALHIFFMVAWFAGIFYLPRLFVYHAESRDPNVHAQLQIMERRLFWFVTPFALLTLVFGVALIVSYGADWFRAAHWLHVKLALVTALYIYHGWLFSLMKKLIHNPHCHSARFFRIINELPVLVLLAVVSLAVVKFI
ncbi:CopD family protein [Bowmanella sp. JS7-9]|uniref:Protoporphyrinogen IX oxidase n=1 Tax=Pseudobowmanella zhangzhouensis TaxID=1537679 RepID=A0ABW1XNC2_9ALTE|nr:CopD family protein [Bowmanella sp. JS7-9]TBX21863.1 membrane protein [Bowmanella sp. JS7-9]